MFQKKYKIMLNHTDAAGVVYFGSLFQLVHSCYEEWLEENNISIRNIIEKESILIPIIEANLRYTAPIYIEDILIISMHFVYQSKFSFQIEYQLTNKKTKKEVASGHTKHACISKGDRKVTPLPPKVTQAIPSC